MALRTSSDRIKETIRVGKAELLRTKADDLKKTIGPEGFKPLHWACHYGQAEVLQRIIDAGADVCSTTNCGWSGLHICAVHGHAECFQVLLDAGADPEQPDSRGYSPLHLSAAHGTATVLQIILKAGVDPNVRDTKGWTPAHHSAYHGRRAAMQTLLQAHANIMLKDSKGCTPAHYAAMEGHTDCLKLLISNSTDVMGLLHAKNNDGLTPLACAVQHHKTESTEYLRSIEQEMDSAKVEYPAHVLCCHGDLTRMKSFIDQGKVSINGRDDVGDTLAHKAAIHGQFECLLWLIQNGADVSLVNSLGETPYDLAVQYRHWACSNLLARSMERMRPFWCTPLWKCCHRTEDPSERLEDLLWGAKGPFMGMHHWHRNPMDHYRDPGDIWVELEAEANEEVHRRSVAELKANLDYERQRRELLEGELDSTRRQLHSAMTKLLHLKMAGPQTMPKGAQTADPQMVSENSPTA